MDIEYKCMRCRKEPIPGTKLFCPKCEKELLTELNETEHDFVVMSPQHCTLCQAHKGRRDGGVVTSISSSICDKCFELV